VGREALEPAALRRGVVALDDGRARRRRRVRRREDPQDPAGAGLAARGRRAREDAVAVREAVGRQGARGGERGLGEGAERRRDGRPELEPGGRARPRRAAAGAAARAQAFVE